MDRIIDLHKKVIFADSIPIQTVDMAARLSFRMNTNNNQKRWFEDKNWMMKMNVVAEPLSLVLESDMLKQARCVWQIEQRAEFIASEAASSQGSGQVLSTPRRKRTFTPSNYVSGVCKTLDNMLDDASIDYFRLTKRCYRILMTRGKFVNVLLHSLNDC